MNPTPERAIPPRRQSILAALKFRDFRLLWSGLLVSNLGTWMQFTAMGYYVAKLDPSPHKVALYLGFLGASRAIPVLLASPIAGVVADTWPRRRILLWANVVMSLAALALAIGTSTGHMDVIGLMIVSAVNSAAQSFDSPARQSWVPMLVDRAYIGNAIGLNSVAFNAPAVIGPAVAAILIASVGVAGCFLVNAVATLAVVAAVAFMKPAPPSTRRREPFHHAIAFGVAFLARHAILKWVLLTFFVTAIFVRPYSMLLPAFIVNLLHGDATALGWALSAAGAGGFGGALLTAYLGNRERRGTIFLASGAAVALGVLALGFVYNIIVALPIIFIIGLGTLTFLGASNTLIQILSPDAVRGRALSVYTMIALGVVPGGALILGALASIVGLHVAFTIGGAITILAIAWLWSTKPIMKTV
ncbi:MAG: MFS transporter [Candidatus Eremiobacteraeota bacterium]|nr:MFS transporter [Candidatus Eremiobacteraeota bacterium]